MPLKLRFSALSAGSASAPPQPAGNDPPSALDDRSRRESAGKEPAVAHDGGSDPRRLLPARLRRLSAVRSCSVAGSVPSSCLEHVPQLRSLRGGKVPGSLRAHPRHAGTLS